MRKRYLVAALTLIAPMAVAAQAPLGNAPASKPDDVTVVGQPSPKTKVCENVVLTGSVKSEKICATQAEFDRVHRDSLIERRRWQDRQLRMRELCRARLACF